MITCSLLQRSKKKLNYEDETLIFDVASYAPLTKNGYFVILEVLKGSDTTAQWSRCQLKVA